VRLAVRTAAAWEQTPYQMMSIGRKATEFLRRRGYPLARSFPMPGVNAAFSEIQAIADAIAGWYESGAVDEVHIAYTVFKSAMVQHAEVVKFLPIEHAPHAPEGRASGAGSAAAPAAPAAPARDYIFEPEAERLLADLLPRYVRNQVYQYLLEAMASEQGARMTAMTAATDNAGELIDTLTLAYNKARQAAITKELLDIVGGAEALKHVN
jgi:F-type H+-transporting ATPase subunit gamma